MARRRYRRMIRIALVLVLAGVVVAALVRMTLDGYYMPWTGFGEYVSPSGSVERAKTLWDWLELLVLPFAVVGSAVALAIAMLRLNRGNAAMVGEEVGRLLAQRGLDKRGSMGEIQSTVDSLAADQAIDEKMPDRLDQEGILQGYLDRISGLLLERELQASKAGAPIRRLARALTLATLIRLDGPRKGILLQFLYEADLISVGTAGKDLILQGERDDESQPIIDLHQADLRGAMLQDANLAGCSLREVDMSRANLHGSDLSSSDLRGADLEGADLSSAILAGSSLRGALLPGANLQATDLTGANLRGTDLSGASLNGADLGNSDMTTAILTTQQLKQVRSLSGATLRDGSRHEG